MRRTNMGALLVIPLLVACSSGRSTVPEREAPPTAPPRASADETPIAQHTKEPHKEQPRAEPIQLPALPNQGFLVSRYGKRGRLEFRDLSGALVATLPRFTVHHEFSNDPINGRRLLSSKGVVYELDVETHRLRPLRPGDARSGAARVTDLTSSVPGCAPSNKHGATTFLTCAGLTRRKGDHRRGYAILKAQRGDDLRTIAGSPYGWGKYGAAGHWRNVQVSPDGRTLLAQWSGECEVPHAFFVPVDGGTPVPVAPEGPGGILPESGGLGWRDDGSAFVYFMHGYCGGSIEVPGVYTVVPGGSPSLLFEVPRGSGVVMWGNDRA